MPAPTSIRRLPARLRLRRDRVTIACDSSRLSRQRSGRRHTAYISAIELDEHRRARSALGKVARYRQTPRPVLPVIAKPSAAKVSGPSGGSDEVTHKKLHCCGLRLQRNRVAGRGPFASGARHSAGRPSSAALLRRRRSSAVRAAQAAPVVTGSFEPDSISWLDSRVMPSETRRAQRSRAASKAMSTILVRITASG
jgi:hypothetical protein